MVRRRTALRAIREIPGDCVDHRTRQDVLLHGVVFRLDPPAYFGGKLDAVQLQSGAKLSGNGANRAGRDPALAANPDSRGRGGDLRIRVVRRNDLETLSDAGACTLRFLMYDSPKGFRLRTVE